MLQLNYPRVVDIGVGWLLLVAVFSPSNGLIYYDTGECVDQRNDCLLFQNICDHPSYEWYMKCSCRRTCNRCTDYMLNRANSGNIAITVNNNLGGAGQWQENNRWDGNRAPSPPFNTANQQAQKPTTTYVYYSEKRRR